MLGGACAHCVIWCNCKKQTLSSQEELIFPAEPLIQSLMDSWSSVFIAPYYVVLWYQSLFGTHHIFCSSQFYLPLGVWTPLYPCTFWLFWILKIQWLLSNFLLWYHCMEIGAIVRQFIITHVSSMNCQFAISFFYDWIVSPLIPVFTLILSHYHHEERIT